MLKPTVRIANLLILHHSFHLLIYVCWSCIYKYILLYLCIYTHFIFLPVSNISVCLLLSLPPLVIFILLILMVAFFWFIFFRYFFYLLIFHLIESWFYIESKNISFEFNAFVFNVIIVILSLALLFYIVSFQCLNLISVSVFFPAQ